MGFYDPDMNGQQAKTFKISCWEIHVERTMVDFAERMNTIYNEHTQGRAEGFKVSALFILFHLHFCSFRIQPEARNQGRILIYFLLISFPGHRGEETGLENRPKTAAWDIYLYNIYK